MGFGARLRFFLFVVFCVSSITCLRKMIKVWLLLLNHKLVASDGRTVQKSVKVTCKMVQVFFVNSFHAEAWHRILDLSQIPEPVPG